MLRYAEVEQYGRRCRLLRLGSCYFEFEASREVFGEAESGYLDTIGEALYDVFSGSRAGVFNVTVHPPDCLSFFAPTPPGLPEAEVHERLQAEASVLDEGGPPRRVAAVETVFEEQTPEGPLAWRHALALPEAVGARIRRVMRLLPEAEVQYRLSTYGAAALMNRIRARRLDACAEGRPPEPETPDYALAIGWHPEHVEFTLCRSGRWHYSHWAPALNPDDCLFFAVSLLRQLRLHPRQVTSLFTYGSRFDLADAPLVGQIFGAAPEVLNPTQIVVLDPVSLSGTFEAEMYVPCIGGVL